MKDKEAIKQASIGTAYKPSVSVRSDKVSLKGDMKMSSTTGAASKATDTKKC